MAGAKDALDARHAGDLETEGHVVENRAPGKQVERLPHGGHPGCAACIVDEVREAHVTPGRREQPAYDLQERALATAARPYDGCHLARGEAAMDIGQRDHRCTGASRVCQPDSLTRNFDLPLRSLAHVNGLELLSRAAASLAGPSSNSISGVTLPVTSCIDCDRNLYCAITESTFGMPS